MNAPLEVKEEAFQTAEVLNDSSSSTIYDANLSSLHDQRDMARMGKKQQFTRNFHTLSSIGFTSCVMGTWEFVFMSNFQNLVDGGRAGMFWGYVWVMAGQFFIVLSLAEMSSMAPTAGGQYHWVSEFAPRSMQKILSYSSGWLSSLCWQCFVATDCILLGQLSMALANMRHPDFVATQWQTALASILFAIVLTIVNIYGARKLHLIETVLFVLHVAGFLVVVITLAVTSPKQSAAQVFTEFYNGGGFPTMGLTVMVGQVTAMWNVLASDAVAHLSEEVKDASVVAPRAMFWSYALNMPIALALIITFLFSLPDPEAATSEGPFPFIYVLKQSLSVAGVQGITALILILLFMIAVSCSASTSRQCFAFARDEGFPASKWLSSVNPTLNVSVPSALLTMAFAIIMSLIYIGSPVAFNAILSLSIVALMATYALSILCVLQRRLRSSQPPLPPARWSLGKWGGAINVVALCYAIYAFFWAFWPLYWQPSAEEFNFASVMFVGVMALAVVAYWTRARKVYKGPVVTCMGREVE